MRRIRWIKASLLTMIAAAPVVASLGIAPSAQAADSDTVPQLVATITTSPLTSRREDAAIQLVNRNTLDAAAQIDLLLKNPDYPAGQIAIAKALAKSVNPNPAFIADLQKLLGPNLDLTEQTALALAGMNFDQNRNASEALENFAIDPHNADNVRIKAITAMGSIVQKPVAEFLIGLIGQPNQSSAIVNAATNSLSELTGISSYGHDVKQWQQWWAGIKTKSAVEFRATVLDTRDQQDKLFKQHQAQVVKIMGDRLRQNYTDLLGVDPRAAEQTLLGYLNDTTPEIRFVGVEIIGLDPLKNAAGAQVRDKLLNMIGDADDNIRLDVIKVLLTVNDPRALSGLVHQITVEKNLEIKVRIIDALGKLQDLTAVPTLLNLLNDPQHEIVVAAADAISTLGAKLRQDSPSTAGNVAAVLRKIADPNAPIPARDDVRAACLQALGALKDKASFNYFYQSVQRAEPSVVRQAALQGFEDLADTNANQIVLDQLGDPDREVRAAAAEALQTTATPEQADDIFKGMKNDTYKKTSDACWIALQNLYPQLRPTDLARIATNLAFDPDKQLVTLQRLGDAYAAANNPRDVAENQQVIATAMAAVKPPRYAEAIDNLTKALAYWRGPGNGDPDKLDSIIGELLDDQLNAGQWDDATKFGAEQIKLNPSYQTTIGPRIKAKAEELSNTDPNAANALINDALKMDPKLRDNYIDQIHEIQDEMKQKATAPPG